LLSGILERITFVPLAVIGSEKRKIAYNLCFDIDPKDTPFISLSLELSLPLWTGDKRLKDGLILKGFHNFYHL